MILFFKHPLSNELVLSSSHAFIHVLYFIYSVFSVCKESCLIKSVLIHIFFFSDWFDCRYKYSRGNNGETALVSFLYSSPLVWRIRKRQNGKRRIKKRRNGKRQSVNPLACLCCCFRCLVDVDVDIETRPERLLLQAPAGANYMAWDCDWTERKLVNDDNNNYYYIDGHIYLNLSK